MPVTADIKVGKRTVLNYLMAAGAAGRLGRDARAVTPVPSAPSARWSDRPDRSGLGAGVAAARHAAGRSGAGGACLPAVRPRRPGRRSPRRNSGVGPLLSRRRRRAGQPGRGRALAGTRRDRGASSRRRRCWPRFSAGLGAGADAGRGASRLDAARLRPTLFDGQRGERPGLRRAPRKWARRAAEAGSADGQAMLGYILTSGPERSAISTRRRAGTERSAEAGCPQGALGYALSLAQSSDGTSRTARGGACICASAAEAGLPTAMYLLGMMTERGAGVRARPDVPPRSSTAKRRRTGNRYGQARWGLALMEGRGVERDASEGESWLRRAALAGRSGGRGAGRRSLCQGRRAAAQLCRGGDLVPPRRRSRASRRGPRAGPAHLTGAGVARDPNEAARWFRCSGRDGRPGLADRSRQSGAAGPRRAGGPRQHARVVRAGCRRAAISSPRSISASASREGVGVERDEQQAAQWLRRAADGVLERAVHVWPDAGRRARHPGRPGGGARLDRPRRRNRDGRRRR